MTRAEIVAASRSYLDVRYRHQGRTRDGVDCVGLLVAIAHDLGIEIPYSTNYSHKPDLQVFAEGVLLYCDAIPLADKGAGDVVLFRLPEERWHTGILTDQDSLLHASARDHKVVEHRLAGTIGTHLKKAFRFKGVE